VRHLLRRNSKAGSRRNIHAHYDLGNPFYRLWLDETMNYSSAWFQGDHTRPMAEAQTAKMQRALDECRLQPGQRVLEIGRLLGREPMEPSAFRSRYLVDSVRPSSHGVGGAQRS
jgi:cyclopropane fatty-acyl-phospholipid synthase-like methyltransferase